MPASSTHLLKKYVSRKVKALVWKPSASSYESSNIFLTGSWDDEENKLCVWHLPDDYGEPVLLHTTQKNNNLNDLKYVNEDTVAVGLGNGSISLYQHNEANGLELRWCWESCHTLNNISVPCTALAVSEKTIASVGEDGKLAILNAENRSVKVVENGGECGESAVTFAHPTEVLSGNLQGHIRVWDTRELREPQATLLSPDQVSIQDLCVHPSQPHLVGAAGLDGALMLWDMRHRSHPLTAISAHKGPMSKAMFHPTSSNHLLSCGFDGQVLLWDVSGADKASMVWDGRNEGLTNAWLTSEVASGNVETTSLVQPSLFPINAIDICNDTLVAGSDNEAIYVVRNIPLS